MSTQRPLLDPNASEADIVRDQVISGYLAEEFAPLPDAVSAAGRAIRERDARIAEYTYAITETMNAEYAERIEAPASLLETYMAAREELLLRRWQEAGVGWCDQHASVVALDMLKLVFHEGMERRTKSDDSYSTYSYSEPFRCIMNMCEDCRGMFGYGIDEEKGSCSYLFEAEKVDGTILVHFPISYTITEPNPEGRRTIGSFMEQAWRESGLEPIGGNMYRNVPDSVLRRREEISKVANAPLTHLASGLEPVPTGTLDKRFTLKGLEFNRSSKAASLARDWHIPPALEFSLVNHRGGKSTHRTVLRTAQKPSSDKTPVSFIDE